MPSSPAPVPVAPQARLLALDWMRGLVMVLMTIDHASGAVNAGRVMSDSTRMYKAGTVLDPAQFLTRWITHLCAPTFVFLAGVALALSLERRRRDGIAERDQDLFLVKRGLVIGLADPLWMSWVFIPGNVLLQVLYAIGGSFIAMAPLRRIPRRWLLAGALAMLVGQEALIGGVMYLCHGEPPLPVALLLTGGRFGRLIIAYPLLPWLTIMVLGYCAGGAMRGLSSEILSRRFALGGALSLAVFAIARGLNGYGNLLLVRDDGSLVQWLHVSKYPPSLTYTTLELGIMALLLALFFRVKSSPAPLAFLRVLGATAFFFYLLHVHLLEGGAWAVGLLHKGGLGATYLAAAIALAILYPLCARYGRYKAAHPDGWTRYV